MKVLVVGNSVALYVRPRLPGALPFPRLLRDRLSRAAGGPVEVEVWARNSLMAADLVGASEDRLLSAGADVVVFNLGIVEATPRVAPQRWRRAFVRGATRGQRVWLAAERAVRRPLLGLLGGATGTSVAAFEAALTRLFRVAREEGGARVYCLGLAPTSARVEEEVPGLLSHLRAFEEALRRAARAGGATCLELAPMLAGLGAERAVPDGIHFSGEGHRAIADALAATILGPAPEPRAGESGGPPAEGGPGWALRAVAVVPAFLLALLALVWVPLARLGRALGGRSR